MKPITKQRPDILKNNLTGPSSAMQIRMTGKVFEILSASLYSNKVRAIIRELSTNAWDAHEEAGTQHIPFDIQLPTSMSPKFRIRDYGTGMDEETVFQTYNCLFASTKDKSNDVTGMLGLGSKTPFAYTDQLTVTSYQDGMKRIYNSLVGEDGIPVMRRVLEISTDEKNGLEIEFTVKDADRQRFVDEAKRVFPAFRRGAKPNFLNSGLDGDALRAKLKEISPNCYLMEDRACFPSTEHRAFVIQGNVAYPMENKYISSEARELLRLLSEETSRNSWSYHRSELLFFEVPIGTVEFTPNRENLEGSAENYARIEPFIQNLLKHFTAHYKALYGHITTIMDAAFYLADNSVKAYFFNQVMREKGLNVTARLDTLLSPNFSEFLTKTDVETKNLKVGRGWRRKGYLNLANLKDPAGGHIQRFEVRPLSMFLKDNFKIILMDEKKRFRSRIKECLPKDTRYLLIKEPAKEPKLLKEVLNWFANFRNVEVLKVSDMPDNFVRRASKTRVKRRWFNEPGGRMASQDLKTLEELGVDPKKPIYYVINNNREISWTGHDRKTFINRTLLRKLGILDKSNPIVAISPSRDIQKLEKAYPGIKRLGQAAQDNFKKKFSKKEVLKKLLYAKPLFASTSGFEVLDEVFKGLDEKEILKYDFGAEYLDIKKNSDQEFLQLAKAVALDEVYGKCYPDNGQLKLVQLDKKAKMEYPLLDRVYTNNIKGNLKDNFRKLLRK